jgi:hypothetical protein
MKINGEWFKTYLLDSTTSIIERIALYTGVAPRYLNFTPNIDSISITTDADIRVTNMLQPFLRQTTLVFPSNLVPVTPSGAGGANFSRKEMEEIFIIEHEILREQPSLYILLENLITTNVDEVWNNRHKKQQQFKDEFIELQKRVETHLKKCKEFEKIKSTKSNGYNETHVRLNLYIDSDAEISEIFNSMSANYQIPYANYNKFFKILHNFQICPSWLEYDLPGGIFMKIDSEIYEGSTDYITKLTEFGSQYEYNHDIQATKSCRFFQRYTNAAIIKSQFNEKSCVLLTVDIVVGAKHLSRDVVFSNLFKTIRCFTESQIITIEEKNSTGLLIFPFQTVLIPIWTDLCMTNSYFNSLVVIDESIRASKKRENIYMYVIDDPLDIITMMTKTTTKPGMFNMATENTFYLRARIKAKTSREAIRYGEIIAKLITIYNDAFESILNIYREFIPDFLENTMQKFSEIKPIDDFLRLKDAAPEIFLANYSRECFKRPTVVSEEEAIHLMETGEKQVIPFPIFGEATKRYYTCNHKTHPYPGLRKNKLENKNKFPYIPCCYIKNQDREGTKLRHYYIQSGIQEQQTAVQNIFLSNKILPPGMSGVLPENIKKLFSIINPDPKYQFVRFGINNNYNSLIEAVMIALNHNNLQFVEPEDRPQVVEKQRVLLNANANIYSSAAKQELYDHKISDIAERLKREKLNALEFFHVMEQYFDCSIFLFTSTDKNPQGTLSIPPHSQIHIKAIPTRPAVFIYQQNKMNEIHCELIVQTVVGLPKTLENMTTFFTFDDYIVQQIWKVFTNINRTFTSSGLVTPVMLPYVKGVLYSKPGKMFLQVVSQYIDIYGKARMLTIKHNNELISFMCDPIAPYASPISTNFVRTSIKYVLQIVDIFKATVVEQRLNADTCREVVITVPSLSVQDPRYLKHQDINRPVDGIRLVILCNDKVLLKNTPINTNLEYETVFKYEKTPLTLYDTNRKITKLLVHHALYMFSMFLHSRNAQPTDKNLSLWINNQTVVNPSMFNQAVKKYNSNQNNIDYIRFYKPNPFIETSSNKMYLPSKEVQIRLAYTIRLFMNTNDSKMVSFYKNKSIQGFYSEISDFLPMPNQSIFEDVKAVNYMLESYKSDMYIIKTLKTESREPYFIYISIYPDNIFIARNVITKHFAFKDQRGRPTKKESFNDDASDSLDDLEPQEEAALVKKHTSKKYKIFHFLEGYHPLHVAIYIVRFWNLYKYNPTANELLQAVRQKVLEEGNIDVYSWVSYQNLTNLTNYLNPAPGLVAGYKIENVVRYTAIMKL